VTPRLDTFNEPTEARQVVDELADTPDDAMCVWDSSALVILRKAFQSIREENAALRGRLAVLESDVSKLTQCNRKHQQLVQQLTTRLTDAVSANSRLHLTSEHLKRELDESSELLHRMHLDKANESRLNCEIQRLEAELAVRNTQLKQQEELSEAKWIRLLEIQRNNDSVIQTELRNEIAKLTKKTDDLAQTLTAERLTHQRTRTGLEQLRLHFADISDEGVKVTRNRCDSTKLDFY
jgi:chromosome segregation ATPase